MALATAAVAMALSFWGTQLEVLQAEKEAVPGGGAPAEGRVDYAAESLCRSGSTRLQGGKGVRIAQYLPSAMLLVSNWHRPRLCCTEAGSAHSCELICRPCRRCELRNCVIQSGKIATVCSE